MNILPMLITALPKATLRPHSSRKHAVRDQMKQRCAHTMLGDIPTEGQPVPHKRMPVTAVSWLSWQKTASCSWEKLRYHTVSFLQLYDSNRRLFRTAVSCVYSGNKQRGPAPSQIRSMQRLLLQTGRWISQGPKGFKLSLKITYEAIRCTNMMHKKNAIDWRKTCSLPNYKECLEAKLNKHLHKLHCKLLRKRSALYSKNLIVFY